jgi:protein-disulfide isomerase
MVGDPVRGPVDAPITIVELADFECPYCARAEATLSALEQAHPGQVRLIWKERPLPMHTHARLAAQAALAAAAQGHFWEYHDLLFAHPDALDRASLEGYAATLGLDVAAWGRALGDPAIDARIQADSADADALQAKGTPTFFVNGHRIVGAQPLSVFEAAIAAPRTR